MGGMNSGARAATPDTDECLRISLCDLRRDGALKRYQWSRRERYWTNGRDNTVAGAVAIIADLDCRQPALRISIKGRAFGLQVDQELEIVTQDQPFGGERFYALCPVTGLRCTTLILPPGQAFFASVRGWGVPYASTREREVDRAMRVIRDVEAQFGKRSMYMRHSTRERLGKRWEKAQKVIETFEEGLFGRW